jgi:hypothetical protein
MLPKRVVEADGIHNWIVLGVEEGEKRTYDSGLRRERARDQSPLE